MSKNQKGFSVIEGLLIVVIVGLLGGIGWYVWDTNRKTRDSLNNADKSLSAETPSPTKKEEKKTPEATINEDIVVCSVNTSAESGAGLKVAFYGYVKGSSHSDIRVEFGKTSDNLSSKTTIFPNGPDECAQFLAHMPADDIEPGKYFYRVSAKASTGETVYSKTDSFTIE